MKPTYCASSNSYIFWVRRNCIWCISNTWTAWRPARASWCPAWKCAAAASKYFCRTILQVIRKRTNSQRISPRLVMPLRILRWAPQPRMHNVNKNKKKNVVSRIATTKQKTTINCNEKLYLCIFCMYVINLSFEARASPHQYWRKAKAMKMYTENELVCKHIA